MSLPHSREKSSFPPQANIMKETKTDICSHRHTFAFRLLFSVTILGALLVGIVYMQTHGSLHCRL